MEEATYNRLIHRIDENRAVLRGILLAHEDGTDGHLEFMSQLATMADVSRLRGDKGGAMIYDLALWKLIEGVVSLEAEAREEADPCRH